MADTDFNSSQNLQAYALLSNLNAAFVRVQKQLDTLEQTGLVDQPTMQSLFRLTKEARAISNSRLLAAFKEIEERELTKLRRSR
jgi:cell fate (sporulation/competence/biofilm development) regulator YlbF (YheA/YmcA/DUF963 family)